MKIFEKLMAMDEQSWKRHANPWSVYSRFSLFPLLSLSLWSRVWLGPWSLFFVGVTLFWTWFNPRAFPPPESTDNWASKGTLGEKFFLNFPYKIPQHHKTFVKFLSILSGAGFFTMCYGLYELLIWPTLFGMTVSMMAKAWVVDRMVWIYEDLH